MVDTGIVRHVDALGRVVIPIEMRRSLGLEALGPISIAQEGDKLVIRRHRDACVFCGSVDDVTEVKKRPVCKPCLTEVKKA